MKAPAQDFSLALAALVSPRTLYSSRCCYRRFITFMSALFLAMCATSFPIVLRRHERPVSVDDGQFDNQRQSGRLELAAFACAG